MEFSHLSVLKNEAVDALAVKPDGIYLDGTIGGGGHSEEIAKRLTGSGRLIGMDQDDEALEAAGERLAPFGDRVTFVRDNFENAVTRLREIGIDGLDGVLLDLGVSSRQFDAPERGFSYRADAPLDMRMDRRQELSAMTIVNEWSEKELFHILRDYGEEPFAANIAKHIVNRRETGRIVTTTDLNAIIDAAIPARVRAKDQGHPARRTYQALRIATNRELDVLQAALETLADMLRDGGRFAVITFHSLEDRMVKQTFRTWENPCTCPPSFPKCVCGKVSKGIVVTKKPVMPGKEETESNRRARSARLRVFERRVQTDES